VHPGSYVTMDDHNRAYGVEFEQAITVLATVVATPAPGRVVIDAGIKALSCDYGKPRVSAPEGLGFERLFEEHSRLVPDGGAAVKVGDTVEIVPSHGCTTVPQFDFYAAVRDGRVVDLLPVLSRGAAY
jgi:D-serine deaminase-like pyridoxal phosphate-dependent protein